MYENGHDIDTPGRYDVSQHFSVCVWTIDHVESDLPCVLFFFFHPLIVVFEEFIFGNSWNIQLSSSIELTTERRYLRL